MLYQLQQYVDKEWVSTDIIVISKVMMDLYIGDEREDYEYRVGYYFKPWEGPISRFVYYNGKNRGKEVKVCNTK